MSAWRVAGFVGVGLIAACHPPPPRAPLTQAQEPTQDLLADIALIATGEPSAVKLYAPPAAGEPVRDALGRYIDRLLQEDSFASRIAPGLLLNEMDSDAVTFSGGRVPLTSVPSPRGKIYAMPGRSCDAKDAVPAHPWWAPDESLLICPNSYLPDVLKAADRREYCSGGGHGPLCGCGPNLYYCFLDEAQEHRVMDSLRDEVRRTIAFWVRDDAPLDRVFTENKTVRDGWADSYYEESKLLTGKTPAGAPPPDPRRYPVDEVARPRPELIPGQHAGILTATNIAYVVGSPRDRMRILYQFIWCTVPAAGAVSAAVIEKIGAVNLRDGDGWQKLAASPVCTTCHARLDYGRQFFTGYTRTDVARSFLPSFQPPGTGKLYAKDINDPRGEAPLNPHAFAELATKQPEFGDCMIQHAGEQVFGRTFSGADIPRYRAGFNEGHGLRPLVRKMLLEYAIGRLEGPRPLKVEGAQSHATGDRVHVSPALRATLDHYCVDCHDEAPRDLRPAELSRDLLERAVNQVAFESMPKTSAGMPATDRRQTVEDMIEALWPDPAERTAARSYYLDAMRALPTHRMDATMAVIHAAAGASPAPDVSFAESYERQTLAQFTPGFAISLATEALSACKLAADKQQLKPGAERTEAIDRCLDRTLSIDAVTH